MDTNFIQYFGGTGRTFTDVVFHHLMQLQQVLIFYSPPCRTKSTIFLYGNLSHLCRKRVFFRFDFKLPQVHPIEGSQSSSIQSYPLEHQPQLNDTSAVQMQNKNYRRMPTSNTARYNKLFSEILKIMDVIATFNQTPSRQYTVESQVLTHITNSEINFLWKGPKIPFISNLKKRTCASKRDVFRTRDFTVDECGKMSYCHL